MNKYAIGHDKIRLIQIKIDQLLSSMQYDFCNFSLNTFIRAVARMTGRKIVVCPADLQYAQGAWVSSDSHEYFYFRRGLTGLSLTRAIVHEAGHFLLLHQTLHLGRTDNEVLFLVTSNKMTMQEQESELFVSAVFARIDGIGSTNELLEFLE